MTDQPTADELAREHFLDPGVSILDVSTQQMVALTDEIRHLRAAGNHWKERALAAEGRVAELQRRLNAELGAPAANGHAAMPAPAFNPNSEIPA